MENRPNQPEMTARQMTEEIERATNPIEAPETSLEQVQALGEVVLGQTTEQAEREVANMESELAQPEEHVGEETPLQQIERAHAEEENLQNENDPHRDTEARLMARGQEAIARVTADEINQAMNAKAVRPSQIWQIWRRRGDQVLDSFENPHPIGSGN